MIKLRLYEAVNYDYYKDKISEEKYKELVHYDPTPDKKYAAWFLNRYIGNKETKDHVDGTRWYIISKSLKDYDTYKTRNVIPAPYNDINKFPSTVALGNYIYENEEEFINRVKAKEKSKGKDVRIVFKDPLNLVVIPLSHEASRKYGTGTNWCTASASAYHYNSYTEDGTLYIHRFLNEDGSYKQEAYQLYIPKEDASSHEKVECNDYSNEVVSSIEDTFLNDLPDEITKEFEDKIEKAGGYDKEYTILGHVYAEKEDGKIRIIYSYELMEVRDGDYDYVGDGDISSQFTIQPVGNGIPLPEVENELEMALLNSDKFNFENGTGLLVMIADITPDEAMAKADSVWRDKVGYWDSHPDDYEARSELEVLKEYSFDYYVINRESKYELFNSIENLIAPYVEELEVESLNLDIGGEKYTVYFKTGYNYNTSGDWASTPRQRRNDKQLDFPDME